MSQSNTQVGDIVIEAGETLTGKEGYLVVMGLGVVRLPNSVDEYAFYLLIEGAASGENCVVRPIFGDRNIRVVLSGNCTAGSVVCLAAIANSDDGQVRELPAASATYRGLGIAEESGTDGQFLLIRPVSIGLIAV